jgi:O-antigen/teichoic acid export membrane protein
MSATGGDIASPAAEDVLSTGEAGGRVIRGSAWRVGANAAGTVFGVAAAALLARHLGVQESGRYFTVLSLVAIAVYIADIGLNVTGSRELARTKRDRRPALIANLLGQRLLIMPLAVLAMVLFALLVGYRTSMVEGTALAGLGVFLVALANVVLLRLTVELRNAGLAFVDLLKQAVTLAGFAVLVALGASLTPFFAVQIAVGLAVVAMVPILLGAHAFVAPRFDRAEQRTLFRSALPVATALALGQVYFRLVIVLMSLISNPTQTGYYGLSLRAMETLIYVPILVAGVALPLLTRAAHEDRERLRNAVRGLSEGAVIAGVLIVVVTIRAAEPLMVIIGGSAFRPAGTVLSIQVAALLFIALYQIWTAGLLAVGRQHELILTNILALTGVTVFAVILIPAFGAEGGAAASVLGDALLASLIYWRFSRAAGRLKMDPRFLLRVAASAAAACAALVIPGLPDLVAAGLAGGIFLGVGQVIGMIPKEVHEAFELRRLISWRSPRGL